MTSRFALLGLLVCGCSQLATHTVEKKPALPETTARELARPLLEDPNLGLAIVLVRGEHSKFIGLGSAYGANTPAPGADTLFEIGSVTKVLTASLLASEVLDGTLSLDTSARSLAGTQMTIPRYEATDISLLHLATHTSGLPRVAAGFSRKTARDFSNEDMGAFLGAHQLRRRPGQAYQYSNLGVGLLAHLLSVHAERDYEDLLRARILGPLGMDDTTLAPSPEQEARVAMGFRRDGAQARPWYVPALRGAGSLRSTARDMTAFVRANLQLPAGPMGETLAFTHAPRFEGRRRVGLGWHLGLPGADDALIHYGRTPGFQTFVALDRRRQIAVVVLANKPVGSVTQLGKALMYLLSKGA